MRSVLQAAFGGVLGVLAASVSLPAMAQAPLSTTSADEIARFETWKIGFIADASAAGIARSTAETALAGMVPLARVVELDRKQPEKTVTFADYRKRVVNAQRIKTAKAKLQEHRQLLNRVSAQFGVPARYLVALWAVETDFGRFTGGFDVVPALATLAFEGRRAELFRGELIEALKIIDRGEAPRGGLRGSWAGAMGQCQFMPSSFNKLAIDFDGDGRRDIWNSLPDVFGSMANYLKEQGWQPGVVWGRAVHVPSDATNLPIGIDTRKPLAEWQKLGLRAIDGKPLPHADVEASLVMPDGITGPGFLVYDNFRTLMQWNRSTYFATSIGLLADMIGDA
ncbi:lytic transglycosylase domain-containing protein [Lacibacterium aquatile]|uniref:Lytic transglycosylase domain-containing protein n=1 Tax=Lacibacterium aquatile TaxID=1168082 RepID=A0ABW5DN63_9PROT